MNAHVDPLADIPHPIPLATTLRGAGELVVDSFAGGGGASTGITIALGRSPDIAINHDPIALAMHARNHPETLHLPHNIWKVNPEEVCQGRPVGMLWASPDCFPAGTMVLTRTGYKAIESIAEGEEVLTDKLRWRKVTATMTTRRPVMTIAGHGHPGLRVSPEHPFEIRSRSDLWDNAARRYRRVLAKPSWVKAGEIASGKSYWATPTTFPQAPLPAIPTIGGRSLAIDPELMRLAGRYVADGWTRDDDKHSELVITCGHEKAEAFESLIRHWQKTGARAGSDEMSWQRRETTAVQYTTHHKGLVTWLRDHFGHKAENKVIPGWLLGATRAMREAFLDGYMAGDGCVVEHKGAIAMCSSVSKALALGIRALAESLGHNTSLFTSKNKQEILGRPVDAKDTWSVRWRLAPSDKHARTEISDGKRWAPIKSVGIPGAVETLYNLSVDEDETYVADGIVVHNCRHHSRAKGAKPVKRNIRDLGWVVVRWAREVRPRVIFVENVPEYCFTPETTVLSKRGVVPIGSLEIGDEVWTHNARWKPVTAISRRMSSTVRIKGYANSIMEATPNHEFYVRQSAPEITVSGKSGRHAKRLLEPEWVRADRLADVDDTSAYTRKYSGYNWATPRALPRYWQRMPERLGVDVNCDAFFYMLGRWLGDGWIKKRRDRNEQDLVRICANNAEADALEGRLAATGLKWTRSRHTPSVEVFDLAVASSRILIPWLRANFGEFAHAKTLPAWIYACEAKLRESLIDGYWDADGHIQEGGLKVASSVSRCLAIGMKMLLQSLDIVAAIGRIPARKTNGINDKQNEMNCRETYTVSWRKSVSREKCLRSELHIWGAVHSVEPGQEKTEVVDITVADDHSFVADGQVVHNCDWGPLDENDRPIKELKGETFRRWVAELNREGYFVEWKEITACDYGSPTIRKRLYIIARRDGQPIVWPEPTHGAPNSKGVKNGTLLTYKTTAEHVIDWTIPCHSIFMDPVEARKLGLKRPLVKATLNRIAAGVKRYVVGTADPYIVSLTHQGGDRVNSIRAPLNTVTSANRGEKGLVNATVTPIAAPFAVSVAHGESGGRRSYSIEETQRTVVAGGVTEALVQAEMSETTDAAFLTSFHQGQVGRDVNEPLATVTSNSFKKRPGGAPPMGIVRTALTVPRYGERPGQEPRCGTVEAPHPTVVGTGNGASLVEAELTEVAAFTSYGQQGGLNRSVEGPMHTVTASKKDSNALVTATLARQFGNSLAADVKEPLGTVTAGGGGKTQLVQAYLEEYSIGAPKVAFMAQHNTGVIGRPVDAPLSTVTQTGSHQSLVTGDLAPAGETAEASFLTHMYSSNEAGGGGDPNEPARTVTAGGYHAAEVRAMLQTYYGTQQDTDIAEALPTVTSKARFGLVEVQGRLMQITDISMRMLTPRELFNAQGFPASYVIDEGICLETHKIIKLSKSAQIRMCGNSVCPDVAAALVKANYVPKTIEEIDRDAMTLDITQDEGMPLFSTAA